MNRTVDLSPAQFNRHERAVEAGFIKDLLRKNEATLTDQQPERLTTDFAHITDATNFLLTLCESPPAFRATWTKTNKSSFKNDDSRSKMIIERFGSKSFREVTPEMIERFKSDLNDSITRRGMRRSHADVNHYLQFLSSVFELAIRYKRASVNPCRMVNGSN